MAAFGRTLVEVLVLSAIGIALGIAANTVRGSSHALEWRKNYFDRGLPIDSPDLSTRAEGKEKRPGHGYQSIELAALKEIVEDGDLHTGRFLFVDSRSESLYKEGHIEGAVRCDPYKVKQCIDGVIERAESTEKTIIYCEGGACEDSIFMCRELIDAGIDCDLICLYEGGWEEWEKNELPVEGKETEE